MVSESAQDYLKAIWKLQQSDEIVHHGRDRGRAGGVSPASATAMLKRLATLGHGRARALPRRHADAGGRAGRARGDPPPPAARAVPDGGARALGWDEVHAEAERLEHHLSEEVEARIDACPRLPHARPARRPDPDAELELERRIRRACSTELEAGDEAVILCVPDGDPALLRYLAELGLLPAERTSRSWSARRSAGRSRSRSRRTARDRGRARRADRRHRVTMTPPRTGRARIVGRRRPAGRGPRARRPPSAR